MSAGPAANGPGAVLIVFFGYKSGMDATLESPHAFSSF